MTRGFGNRSEYPKLVERLAQHYPVGQYPGVWQFYRERKPGIEAISGMRMPDVRQLRAAANSRRSVRWTPWAYLNPVTHEVISYAKPYWELTKKGPGRAKKVLGHIKRKEYKKAAREYAKVMSATLGEAATTSLGHAEGALARANAGRTMKAIFPGTCAVCSQQIVPGQTIADTGARGPRGGKRVAHVECGVIGLANPW